MTRNLTLPIAALCAWMGCGSNKTPAAPDMGGQQAADMSGSGAADMGNTMTPPNPLLAVAAQQSAGLGALGMARMLGELFGPQSLDPTDTLDNNTQALLDNLMSNISADGTTTPCGTTPVMSGTQVSMNFGAACQLSAGTVAGSASATLSMSGGNLVIGFDFTQLSVDGLAISGTLSGSTPDAATFAYTGALDIPALHVTFQGTLDTDNTGVVITGSGAVQDSNTAPSSAGTAVPYTAAAVHYSFGSCFPDSGSAAFTESGSHQALATFLQSTSADGKLQVSVDGQTAKVAAPSFGMCP